MSALVGKQGLGVQAVGVIQAPGLEQCRQRPPGKTNFQVDQVAQFPAALWRRAGITAEYVQNEHGAALLDALKGIQGTFQRGEWIEVIPDEQGYLDQ